MIMANHNPSSSSKANADATLWDCGSTLYDSFELNSFKRQLDSAIANSARSLSMPHLSDRRLPLPPPPPPPPAPTVSKKPFKISRSLHMFLRSVFKHSNNHRNLNKSSSVNSSSSSFEVPQKSRERYLVVYEKSGQVLSSIPEQPEFEMARFSPDISSLAKRSASERFTRTKMGISCA